MPKRLSTPFISLREVAFRLGDNLVFENTSWTWRRDEQWAILGPNGSGKSLFADCLRGKVPLVRGDLRYHFRGPAGLSAEEAIGQVNFDARRREVHGAVVQSRWNSIEEEGALQVCEHLSYERVLELNPFEVRGNDARARAAFARRLRRAERLLEIRELWNRTLLSLSNGERQRVELARVLCRPLRLLILDEPLAGLDRAARQRFSSVLQRLMASSLRVLFICSRAEDVPEPVTHVFEVRDCEVVRAGPRLPKERHPHLEVSAGLRRARPRRPLRHGRVLVALRDVTVRYGDAVILDRLTWTIYAGESWALLGPNGSGKSTILSLILGDHPQAYGNDVVVFGHPRGSGESIWQIKRRIGWVSPELQTHFSQEATCFEVVASGFLDTNGLFEEPTPRQRRAALEWLERFGLLPSAETPLFALSAGLQRMALLARALVKGPSLLLLDEPCQGLDNEHCSSFVRMMNALMRERAATVVYVTHREEEIPSAITRVLRLGNLSSASRRAD